MPGNQAWTFYHQEQGDKQKQPGTAQSSSSRDSMACSCRQRCRCLRRTSQQLLPTTPHVSFPAPCRCLCQMEPGLMSTQLQGAGDTQSSAFWLPSFIRHTGWGEEWVESEPMATQETFLNHTRVKHIITIFDPQCGERLFLHIFWNATILWVSPKNSCLSRSRNM